MAERKRRHDIMEQQPSKRQRMEPGAGSGTGAVTTNSQVQVMVKNQMDKQAQEEEENQEENPLAGVLNSHSNDASHDLNGGLGEVVQVIQTEDIPNIEITA